MVLQLGQARMAHMAPARELVIVLPTAVVSGREIMLCSLLYPKVNPLHQEPPT